MNQASSASLAARPNYFTLATVALLILYMCLCIQTLLMLVNVMWFPRA